MHSVGAEALSSSGEDSTGIDLKKKGKYIKEKSYKSCTISLLHIYESTLYIQTPNPVSLRSMNSRDNSFADYRLGQIYLFEPDFFDMDAALECLNGSAQAGNESASTALQRMAENSFPAITTNVLELVGGLCDIEPRRPVKDCTTLPQKRERRKWEQSM